MAVDLIDSPRFFETGGVMHRFNRFKRCFLWCPFSCRNLYRRRRVPSVTVEEQMSPNMNLGSIWNRALLSSNEIDQNSSVDSGKIGEDDEGGCCQPDDIMPRECRVRIFHDAGAGSGLASMKMEDAITRYSSKVEEAEPCLSGCQKKSDVDVKLVCGKASETCLDEDASDVRRGGASSSTGF